jgi:O-antigen/teichoic acid export membrane protein
LALVLKTLAAGLAFGFNVALARTFGPEGAGVYLLALSMITAACIVGRLGLDTVLLRQVAAGAATRDWSQVEGASGTGLRLALATSAAATAGVFALAPWLAAAFGMPALAAPLRWMSLSIVPLTLAMLLSESLKGLRRIFDSQVVNGVAVPAVSLGVLLGVGPRLGLQGAVLAHVAAAATALALGLAWWRRAAPPRPGAPPAAVPPRALLSSGLPFFWSQLTTFCMQWVGVVGLGLWRSEAEVGIFSLAMRTAMLTSLLLISVNTIAAPKFAALHRQGDLAGLEATAAATTWLMVAAAGPLLLVFLLAPARVMGLFGSGFVAGASALAVLALGQFVNAATGSVGQLLLMSGHERLFRNTVLASAVINVALTAAAVPRFGILGAALATTVSQVVKNLAAAWLVATRVHVRPWRLPGRRIAAAGRRP